MAMGLPVLANQADGVQEVIQDGITGYLFQPGQLNQMAQTCQVLIERPTLRAEIGHRARDFIVQEFDLEVMIQQISALYEKLLSDR